MLKKFVAEQLKGLLDCSICLERYDEPRMLSCTHEFCKQCIEQLARFQDDGSVVIACPMRCKEETKLTKDQTVNDLTSSYNFKNVLHALTEDDHEGDGRVVQCTYSSDCKKKPVTVFCCGGVMCDSCFGKHEKCCSISSDLKENINNDDNKENDSGFINKGNENNNIDSNSSHKPGAHEKITLGFSKTDGKLMVVCNDHSCFCTSLCEDNKLLCTYCKHRYPEHNNHNKTDIEEEVNSLRETLKTELNVRKQIMKFKEATHKHYERRRGQLEELLSQRKAECLRQYSEYLDEEEMRLMEQFDDNYEMHLSEEYEDDIDVFPPEYCKNILQKHDVELLLQREDIWKEIMGSSRIDLMGTTSDILTESEDFLGTEPLGDIKNEYLGSVPYSGVPCSTYKFEFATTGKVESEVIIEESEVKEELTLCHNSNVSLELKSRGNNCFKKHLYQEAKACYSKAIQLCPKDLPELAALYQNRAAAFEKLGRDEDCIDDCREALEVNSRYLKALHRRSRVLERQGFLKNAFNDALTARFLDEQDGEQKYRDAKILKAYGKELAKEFLKKQNNRYFWLPPINRTIREVINDDNHDLFHIKRSCNNCEELLFAKIEKDLELEEYEKVVETCGEVIKLNGEHKYRALLLRGTICLCKHNDDQAAADFDVIINNMEGVRNGFVDMEKEHLRTAARIKRACLRLCIGDKGGFDTDFLTMELTSVMMSDKDISSMHYNIANFGVHFIPHAKLIDHYQKAIAHDASFISPRLRHCDLLLSVLDATKNPNPSIIKSAENACSQIVQLFPEDSRSWVKHGEFLLKMKKFDEALEAIEKAITVAPNTPLPYLCKAKVFVCRSDFKGAAELYEKALLIDDQCYDALLLYGRLKEKMGEYEEAATLFLKSIEGCYRMVCTLSDVFEAIEENKAKAEILKEHAGYGEFR